jgi:hypothetical protein
MCMDYTVVAVTQRSTAAPQAAYVCRGYLYLSDICRTIADKHTQTVGSNSVDRA